MPITEQAADRSAVVSNLRSWLLRANPEAVAMGLEADTDIIESRILESLQVVEFILFLEAQSGREILSEDLDTGTLRTIDSIYATFFEVRQ